MRKRLCRGISLCLILGLLAAGIPCVYSRADSDETAAEAKAEYPEMFLKAGSVYGYQLLSGGLKKDYERILTTARAVITENRELEPLDSKAFGEMESDEEDYYTMGGVVLSHVKSEKELELLWYSFEHDHPELYWIQGGYMSVSDAAGRPVAIYPRVFSAFATDESRDAMDQLIESEVENYLLSVKDETNIYEKVRIIHDKIIETIDYAYDVSDNTDMSDAAHSIVGVFDSQYYFAVCEGYSKAFAFLLNYLGIPQVYVTGTVSDGGHAWNVVSFDGGAVYYDMDITWDDVGSGGSAPMQYRYFAMNDTWFSVSHTPFDQSAKSEVRQYALPTLGADDNMSYYHHYGADLYQYPQEQWIAQAKTACSLCPHDTVPIVIAEKNYVTFLKAIGYEGGISYSPLEEYTADTLYTLYFSKSKLSGLVLAAERTGEDQTTVSPSSDTEKNTSSSQTGDKDNTGTSSAGKQADESAAAASQGNSGRQAEYSEQTEESVVESKAAMKVGTIYENKSTHAIYKVTKGNTVMYMGPTSQKYKTLVIPDTIAVDGVTYKVTAIQKNACRKWKKLNRVTIGINISKIGAGAFYNCKSLRKVTIKSKKLKKTSLGKKAFAKNSPKCVYVCALKKYKAFLRKAGADGKFK